jgi:hypothetical protein
MQQPLKTVSNQYSVHPSPTLPRQTAAIVAQDLNRPAITALLDN